MMPRREFQSLAFRHAGDTVYRGVHPPTADSTPASRRAWIATLDEIRALGPTTVIAGHKEPTLDDSAAGPAQTRACLVTFDVLRAASTSTAELERSLVAKFPRLQLPVSAHSGAVAAFAPAH